MFKFLDPLEFIKNSPDLDLRVQPRDLHTPVYVGRILGVAECESAIAVINGKLHNSEGWDSLVYDYGKPTNSAIAASRVSKQVRPTGPHFDAIYSAVDSRVRDIATKIFTGFQQANLRRFDDQALIYYAGGLFRQHADDSILRSRKWFYNQPRRQLTAILYLSEQDEEIPSSSQSFTGGSLVFPNIQDSWGQRLVISPRAGRLVVFPSHPQYVHEVLPVRTGERFAITRWYTVQSDEELRPKSVELPRMPTAPNLPAA